MYFTQLLYFLIFLNSKLCEVKTDRFIMPDEGDPHSATWMAYGATLDAWGNKLSFGASRLIARRDLLRIASNLARFEHVKMIVNENELRDAEERFSEIKNEVVNINSGEKPLPSFEAGGKIEFIKHPVNDLWIRDTGPVFVFDSNKLIHAVNFNFNGWGQSDTGADGWKKSLVKISNGIVDQRIEEDKLIADFIIQRTGVKGIETWLVMEGGGIEVNGKGTAICTESCILNENRNPEKTKKDVENELLRVLGVKKVIWLPGLRGKDITDGHVDFYARFVGDTKVVCSMESDEKSPDYKVTHENYEILSKASDAFGKKITVIQLIRPDYMKVKDAVIARNSWSNNKTFFNTAGFAAGYVGFYVANKCVIMSMFGDQDADERAFNTLSDIYPDRTIIQITTDGIANGGGSIHCATQQQIYNVGNLNSPSLLSILLILPFGFILQSILFL